MAHPKRQYGGITNAQKALLHKAKHDLGLDDDTYREMLRNVAGVRSSVELSQSGFNAVMAHLQAAGFRKTHGAHEFSGYTARLKKWQVLGLRPGMATPAQLARIETDWELMRWYWAPKGFANMELALRGFIGKVAGVTDLRFLSGKKAVQVITALKHTEARRNHTDDIKKEATECDKG